MNEEKLLTAEELAERWMVSARTLEGWRNAGKGPVWLKIGGQVRYRLADILAYESEAER